LVEKHVSKGSATPTSEGGRAAVSLKVLEPPKPNFAWWSNWMWGKCYMVNYEHWRSTVCGS